MSWCTIEHKEAVRRGDTNNGIAVHAWEYWRALRSRDMLRTQTLTVGWYWILSGLHSWRCDLYHHSPPSQCNYHITSDLPINSCHYLSLFICAVSHYSWWRSMDQNILWQLLSICYNKLIKVLTTHNKEHLPDNPYSSLHPCMWKGRSSRWKFESAFISNNLIKDSIWYTMFQRK